MDKLKVVAVLDTVAVGVVGAKNKGRGVDRLLTTQLSEKVAVQVLFCATVVIAVS